MLAVRPNEAPPALNPCTLLLLLLLLDADRSISSTVCGAQRLYDIHVNPTVGGSDRSSALSL